MSLSPGTRLGPYEIVSPVGAGGMGEVYRARDTRLDRTVAIKVLPPEIADDPELRERFEREGRAISQISHPHICVLHDIGHAAPPGGDDAPQAFLVMEYLDGETLQARLAHGPLPLDQALTIAVQICGALDAAHRHGIVHRDIKPGNVMLTKAGAKLLDFGLARECAVSLPDAAATMMGAAAGNKTALTGQGSILGTVQYMSPEQVEGKPVDARTDIWAFGCVVYEMVTGAPAFAGGSPASVIAAILEREPIPACQLQPATPPAVERVIRTCLEKDPAERWQSSRDLLRELKWIGEARRPAPALSAAAQPAKRGRRLLLTAGAGMLIMAALGAAWFGIRSARPEVAAGPPVVVLMDSTHPDRVYDPETRKAGGTNADDLTDLLRDLPVLLVKENTNSAWHREDEVLRQHPALVVAHRSCFFDATYFPDRELSAQTYPFAADKFELFMGYVGLGNTKTKFLVYSRGSWKSEEERAKWETDVAQRFPLLKGRVRAWRVPLDRATYRNPKTGAEIKELVKSALGLS